MNENSFGKWLEAARDRKGWDTQRLSAESGVSQPLISMYENGRRNPKPDKIRCLAEALGADVDQALLAAGYAPKSGKIEKHKTLAPYDVVPMEKDGKDIPGYKYPGVEVGGKMIWMVAEEPQDEEEVEDMRLALLVAISRKRQSS